MKKSVKKTFLLLSGLITLGSTLGVVSYVGMQNYNQTSTTNTTTFSSTKQVQSSRTVELTGTDVANFVTQGRIQSVDGNDVLSDATSIRIYDASSQFWYNNTGGQLSPIWTVSPTDSFVNQSYSGTGTTLGYNQYNWAFFKDITTGQWVFRGPANPSSTPLDIDDAVSTDLTLGFKIYQIDEELNPSNSNNTSSLGDTYFENNEYIGMNQSIQETDPLFNTINRYWGVPSLNVSNSVLIRPMQNNLINGVVKIQNRGYARQLVTQPTSGTSYKNNGTPLDYITISRTNKTNEQVSSIVSQGTTWLKQNNTAIYNLGTSGVENLQVGALNVGLYDGKIYFGQNQQSINLARSSSFDFTSYTPESFANASADILLNAINVTVTNAPNSVLNGGMIIDAVNNPNSQKVDVTITTNRSFRPDLTTNANGELVNYNWVSNQPMSSTISIPYSVFNQTTQITTIKSSVSLTDLGISGEIYADDFVANVSNSQTLINNAIQANPSILFNNAPASGWGLPYIQNGASGISLSLVSGSNNATESIRMTLRYLSNNGNSVEQPTYTTQDSVVDITGFKNGVITPVNTLDLTNTTLGSYTISQLTENQNHYLVNYFRQPSIISTLFANASTNFIDLNSQQMTVTVQNPNYAQGSFTMVLGVKGLGTSTGYVDQDVSISVTGARPVVVDETNFANNGQFNLTSFTNLPSTTYSIDFSGSQGEQLVNNMLTFMNANPSTFLINSPSTSLPHFRNLTVSNINNSTVTFNVEYLKNTLTDPEYTSSQFSLIGLNTNATQLKSEYTQTGNGLLVSGINGVYASQNLDGATQSTIIQTINANIVNLFESIPADFSQNTINSINVVSANPTEGYVVVSINVNGFTSTTPSNNTVTAQIKITGFHQVSSNTNTLIATPMTISTFNSLAQLSSVPGQNLLNNLNGEYASDVVTIINNDLTSYESVFRNVIEANPSNFLQNYSNVANLSIIKPNSYLTFARNEASPSSINVSGEFLSDPVAATYIRGTITISGFSVEATSYSGSILSIDELNSIVGRNVNTLSAPAVASLLNGETISGNGVTMDGSIVRARLLDTINNNASGYFTGGINDQLSNLINNKTLATQTNVVATASIGSSGFYDVLTLTVNNLPLSQATGAIVNTNTTVLVATPDTGYNFIPTTESGGIIIQIQNASTSQDLTWVWILIGCLLGAVLLAILIYLLVKYLQNRPTNYNSSVGDDLGDYDSSYSDDYYDYF